MKQSTQPQTKPQEKTTPDMATLMHMGIYIPADIPKERLTEKGQELAGKAPSDK